MLDPQSCPAGRDAPGRQRTGFIPPAPVDSNMAAVADTYSVAQGTGSADGIGGLEKSLTQPDRGFLGLEKGVSKSKMFEASRPDSEQTEFEQWLRPYLSDIWVFVARFAPSGRAEDTYQETLLTAWRRRDTYDAARANPKRGCYSWLTISLPRQGDYPGDSSGMAVVRSNLGPGLATCPPTQKQSRTRW